MSAQPLNKGSRFSGPIRSSTAESDGEIVVPGHQFRFAGGTWLFTRSAIGNYFMRKPAIAASDGAVLCLSQLFKKVGTDPITDQLDSASLSTAETGEYIAQAADQGNFQNALGGPTARTRGFKVSSIDVIYGITTLAIATAHTIALRRTTYATGVAPSVATIGGSLSGSLATATNAQPYVTTITVGTPFIIGSNTTDVLDWLEINVDTTGGATTVYDLYAVVLKGSYNLL